MLCRTMLCCVVCFWVVYLWCGVVCVVCCSLVWFGERSVRRAFESFRTLLSPFLFFKWRYSTTSLFNLYLFFSINVSVILYAHLSFCFRSVCLCVCAFVSVFLYVRLSAYLLECVSVCQSVFLSIHVSISFSAADSPSFSFSFPFSRYLSRCSMLWRESTSALLYR